MAELYSFFNSKNHDRKYNARHWADYFFPLFKTGVFNGDLQVTANNDMSVTINAGYAWIDGYVYHLTEPLRINLEMADGVANRIDNIVVRLDLVNRWIKSYAVTGPYYNGVEVVNTPQITSTVHEIVIARINMAAGTTTITQDLIEDTRMDDTVCGWVCGAVEQIKFEQIYAQFRAFQKNKEEEIKEKINEYTLWKENFVINQKNTFDTLNADYKTKMNKFLSDSADEFDSWFTESTTDWTEEIYHWFNVLKDQLSEDAAVNLQNQIYNINAVLREITESEIDEIISGTYEGSEGGMEPDIYSQISSEEIVSIVNNAFGGGDS